MTEEIMKDVLTGKDGNIGLITLNRPSALNSLTNNMCVALHKQFIAWDSEPSIKAVIVEGAGEKAFCAGGDIVSLYHGMKNKDPNVSNFFKDEYEMNKCLFHFKKPYISLVHGIVMGGGLGVSMPASHRVVDENVKLAMPETGIGFFPDVGGSYYLSRLPNKVGMYAGLTGFRFNQAEALHFGFATHGVKRNQFDALKKALCDVSVNDHSDVDRVLASFSTPPESENRLSTFEHPIEEIFSSDNVLSILQLLQDKGDAWSEKTFDILSKKSPTSLCVTHRQLTLGKSMSFDDCMSMEYKIAKQFSISHDFSEGVRALLIDKDNNPQWDPDNISGVSDDVMSPFF